METDIFDAPPVAAPVLAATFEARPDMPLTTSDKSHLIRQPAPQQVIDTSVDSLIRVALETRADVAQLERLYNLKRQVEADDAKREMSNALAQFKKNAPKLFKDAHVAYKTDKGVTEYDHATLGAICEVIIESLADYGLTHSWNPKTIGPSRVSVTCILQHGIATREVTLEADFDLSGKKNVIQGQGSAITYLERYTLLAVVGLAVKGMPDDDGRATQASENAVAILTEQILDGLLAQIPTTKTDAEAFALYTTGAQALKVTKNVDALNEFRQRVAEHRRALAARSAQ
jgi:hypothetical protein